MRSSPPTDAQPGSLSADGRELAFIVGHYKSGSTWLANLLSLHPAIQGVRETHVFRYTSGEVSRQECTEQLFESVAWAGGGSASLVRHRLGNLLRPLRRKGQATLRVEERPATLLDLSVREQRKLRSRLDGCTDWDDYRRAFFESLVAAFRPERYLLEKTPTNVPWVPEIRRLFPAAKLICVFRDGRDVVVSDKYHLRNEYGQEQAFDESILRWKEAMESQLELSEPFDVACVAYEELLGDTRPQVEKILDHLELPTDPATVDDMIERSSFRFVTGRPLGTESKGDFYRKGGSGDWVNHLDREQRERFHRLAGDLLIRLGYEHDDSWLTR